MRATPAGFIATILVLVLGVGFGFGRPSDDTQDRADIEKVFETYLQSLNAADVELASRVWLQSPDLLVVTPVGRFQGWDSVRDDIYVNGMQKQFVERNARASNASIVVSGDAAWLVYDFVFTAKRADGQLLTSKGWESHGYLRTEDGWRIAQLHYSLSAPAHQ